MARKDRNGASDPFVRLRYNGKTQESTVSAAPAIPNLPRLQWNQSMGNLEPSLSPSIPSLLSLRDTPTQQEGTKLLLLQVVKKSCYPRWNETFEFELAEPAGEKLCVEVWDWDLVGRNDFLGKVSLKPFQCC